MHPISISATLLSKYCSAAPQGHAIQSDWRRDEEPARSNVFHLLIIYNGKERLQWEINQHAADALISKWGDISWNAH